MNESKDLQVTVQGGSAVQRSPEAQTLERLQTVRETLAPDLTNGELELFAMVAVRSGLDPFAKQIYAVKRQGRMTIQTGIDGYRSIAARTGEYDGQDEPVYGPDCPCGKGSRHPESSTVRVYRKGMSRAVAATAFWHEYCPDPGPSGKGDQMWRRMPHVMIAKVAEALALRKAFPWDPNRGLGIGSDVYTTEEMAQAESPAPVISVQDRVAARAAAAPGVSLRDFAEAAVGMEPETVRAVRNSMFPDGRSVSDLRDDERAALLHRLQQGPVEEETEDVTPTGDDGPPLVQQEEAEPQEDRRDPVPVLEGVTVITPEGSHLGTLNDDDSISVACEAPSPFTDGAVCLLPKRHRGAHRSSDQETWSR
jgi:phage recombination protein Bet